MTRSPDRSFERFRRTGDPRALGDVFDAVAPEALRIARWLAPRGIEPEDLVQRTFLTAIEAAPRWDPARPVVPWLLGILANHAREAARAARRSVDAARLAPREAPAPDAVALRREAALVADAALDGLGDPARAVLVLRFRHGLEPGEIAHVLRMPDGTVRSHLHRGLERLRRAIPQGLSAAAALPTPSASALAGVRRVVLDRARATAPAAAAGAAPSAGAIVAIAAVVLVGGTAAFAAWSKTAPWQAATASGSDAGSHAAGAVPQAPRLATAATPRDRDELVLVANAEAATPAAAGPAAAGEAPPGPDPGLPSERVTIDVTVVDDLGRRIPGAHLRAAWGEATAGPSTTDEAGRCRLEAAPGSRCIEVFGVDPDPETPCDYSLVTYSPLDIGQRVARVVVPRHVRARGRVEDPRGEPVAGAILNAVRAGAHVGGGASGDDGSFEVGFPAGEPVDVVFGGMVSTKPHTIGVTMGRGMLRRVAGGDAGLVLVVADARPDGVLVVRVLDPDGRPVPRVTVHAPWGLPFGQKGAVTDASGLARVEGIPAWPCQAVLFPSEGRFGHQDLLGAVPDGSEIVATMRSSARLRGRVVGPDGTPLSGAWIGAYDKAGVAAAFGTDAEGRFDSIANRPLGAALQLTARHPMENATARGHALARAGVDEPEIRLVALPLPPSPPVPRVHGIGRLTPQ